MVHIHKVLPHLLGGVLASSILGFAAAGIRNRKGTRTPPAATDPGQPQHAATAALVAAAAAPAAAATWWWLPAGLEVLFTSLTALADVAKHQPPHRSAIDLAAVERFCGCWQKDRAQSESMDGFCDLFAVPRWLRQATLLFSGLDISISGDQLLVKQVCRLPWLSTTEAFPLDGSGSKPQRRRDRRAGRQTGTLEAASADGQMQLVVRWEGSMPGCACDILLLSADDKLLTIRHSAEVSGRGSTSFREVLRRAGSSAGSSARAKDC